MLYTRTNSGGFFFSGGLFHGIDCHELVLDIILIFCFLDLFLDVDLNGFIASSLNILEDSQRVDKKELKRESKSKQEGDYPCRLVDVRGGVGRGRQMDY